MFIELHIIQNFAPSNLNRDDSNSPKDCIFGGVRRARISSQCIKRSVRLHPAFAEETGVEPASRTRFLASAISKRLQELGKPQEEADLAASNFIGILLGGTDQKNPLQSKVLFYVSLEEKEQLTNLILENWEAALAALAGEKQKSVLEKAAKDYKKAFQKRTSAPDIAMFGRMLAEDPNLNMDAACQVAHAISTHRVNMEFDFFTAVDDLQDKEQTGAGMMGVIGFNAATFYRYANIDFEQLTKNLGNNKDLAIKAVRGFLKASALAIPTGKQNSFAAQNPPSFLLAVVRRDGNSWSLANAFEKPVSAAGELSLLEASIAALDDYWGNLQNFVQDDAQAYVTTLGTDAILTNLKDALVPGLNTWIEKVTAEIEKEV